MQRTSLHGASSFLPTTDAVPYIQVQTEDHTHSSGKATPCKARQPAWKMHYDTLQYLRMRFAVTFVVFANLNVRSELVTMWSALQHALTNRCACQQCLFTDHEQPHAG